METLDSEDELLCLLARTPLPETTLPHILGLFKEPLDWDKIFSAAVLHRVLPRLYQNLKKIPEGLVPEPVLTRFRQAYFANTARNLRFASYLGKLLQILKGKGIQAIPFKGPILAQALLGDLALRQFTDLDILVRKKEAWPAAEELLKAGYSPEISLTASQFHSYARRNKSLSFVGPEYGIPVDLHWDLGGDYASAPMAYDTLKARFQSTELLGMNFLSLGAQDLFLYLCLHGAMESWSRLDHICCIAETIQKEPNVLSVEAFETATRIHLRKYFLAGCALAESLLDCHLPVFLRAEIRRDRHISSYVHTHIRQSFRRDHSNSENTQKPKFSRDHLLLKDGSAEKVRHVLFLLFSPTIKDWRTLPLPGSLGFFLHGYRPLRLGMDAARRAMKHRARRGV